MPASIFPTKEIEKLTDRRSYSVTTDCDAALHPQVSSHVFNSRIQTDKKGKTAQKLLSVKLELSGRGEHDVPKRCCYLGEEVLSFGRRLLGVWKLPTRFMYEHVAGVESFFCRLCGPHWSSSGSAQSPPPPSTEAFWHLGSTLTGTQSRWNVAMAKMLSGRLFSKPQLWNRCSASVEVINVQHGP